MMTLKISALLLVSAVLAFGQQEERKVDHVTDDVVVLDNGEAYESQDPSVENWQEGDDVTVDDGTLVNQDQDDEVGVTLTDEPEEE